MTLTDFLLARIAEDQKIAQRRHWHDEDCDSCNPDAEGDTFPCDCRVPERLASECEAKRRIIEWHRVDDMGRCIDDHHYPAPCPTLQLLALPYASHPDYREEWRL